MHGMCSPSLALSRRWMSSALHLRDRRADRFARLAIFSGQTTLYRFITRCRLAELRFGRFGRLMHDRGSCLSVCCI
jgi:hypothetical protein